jgi:hypothetical protein
MYHAKNMGTQIAAEFTTQLILLRICDNFKPDSSAQDVHKQQNGRSHISTGEDNAAIAMETFTQS